MLEAVKTVKQEILSTGTEESFHSLFAATVESAAELDLEPIVLPRQRKPPKRFTGPAAAHHHTSAEEYYTEPYITHLLMLQYNSWMTGLPVKKQDCTSTAN